MNNVEGKVVIITGASSGIGEQTARSLVREGVKVKRRLCSMDRF